MNYYCTLFDSGYLTRGLSLYNSLCKNDNDFILVVVAFDDLCFQILTQLGLEKMKIVSLKDFESERLLRIKKTRDRREYCWTCSCFSILYCLEEFNFPEVTYLDADIYFYNSPSIIFDEFYKSGKDVLITKHNFSKKYSKSIISGIYCVQFMTFKNNENGLKVLNWWCDRCEEWCYARYEDGKFGDQKYLNDWPTRFDSVYVLENIGGGVAPWNIQQYKFSKDYIVNGLKIVFYHFENLTIYSDRYDLGFYQLPKSVIRDLYIPYIRELKSNYTLVGEVMNSTFDKGIRGSFYISIKSFVIRILKRCYNIIKVV